MEYIKRPMYIEKIKPFIGKSLIKVLVGQRRVGKSFLLLQLIDIVKEANPEMQIIYINKELREYSFITNAQELFAYIDEKSNGKSKVSLFIDEIQDIDSFELVLRDLVARKNFDIYCTGSNANLLSGDLATYLSGRYIEIKVFGLSYAEYLQFNGYSDSDDIFLDYLVFGSLPYLIHLEKDVTIVYEYLHSIYNTILLKDVVARFNIRNVTFLENLVFFLADNTGSIVSAKKISDYLKSQKINISTQVVIDYLNYLQSSFMVFKVKRMGIEGKKIFEIGDKFYFEDIGIRNAVVGYKPGDIHKILENIVYLHLRMAGYSVNVGVKGNREIDFLAEKSGERMYVQVAYMLTDQSTIDREFGNLLKIQDNFPKYVVSMDKISEKASYMGIIRLHVKDFCLKLVTG